MQDSPAGARGRRAAAIQARGVADAGSGIPAGGRSLELAPRNSRGLHNAGVLSRALGRVEEAIGLYRQALTQDPLSSPIYHNLGLTLDGAGRFTEAEAAYRKALELAPRAATMGSSLSLTMLALGRGEDALEEANRDPHEGPRSWALAIIHHVLGQVAESNAALQKLIEKNSDNFAFQIAEVYAVRGETDRAFEWLERAYAQRDGGLVDLKSTRHLRSLHDDPRWGPFVRKMRLED